MAVLPRQPHIHNGKVKMLPAKRRKGAFRISKAFGSVSYIRKIIGQCFQNAWFIIKY